MKVVVRERAADDLDRIHSWIAKDHPRAASEVVARLKNRINQLELNSLTHMGRSGLIEGTRELLELPYVIVYRVNAAEAEISVLAIFHTAQDRKRDSFG
jgi:toxin ParE1/3/4